jgi:hypothetical protein
MHTTTRRWLLALLAAGAAACSHDKPAAPATATRPVPAASAAAHEAEGMARICPMNVPGTKVSASDTPSGAAVAFTTTPDQVPALRERVRAMAEMHEKHRAAGVAGASAPAGTPGGARGGPSGHGHGGMPMPPPAKATVEDVEGGARIVATPLDPVDLEKLRSATRMHAAHLQQHGCEMSPAPARQ